MAEERASRRRGRASRAVPVGLVLASFAVSTAAVSSEAALGFDRYEHATWPTGGRAAAAFAVLPSRGGDLFVGTSEGLARFDGSIMVGVRPPRQEHADESAVSTIFETTAGVVFAGTARRGLLRVEGDRVDALGTAEGLPSSDVRSFAETADGTVWIATSAGVVRLGPRAQRATHASNELPHVCVHALAVDSAGILWAGTHAGLARWSTDRWLRVPIPQAAGGAIDHLWADVDGTLWIGTRDQGLWRRTGDDFRFFGKEQGLGSNQISAVRRDSRKRLWVATERGHLAVMVDGDHFETLPLPASLCPDQIEALAEDAEGGMWIGTKRCGLHRLSERPFERVARAQGLPVDSVVGLNLDRQGNVWVGTGEGGVLRAPDADLRRMSLVPCTAGRACEECWDLSPNARAGDFFAVCTPRVLLRWDGHALTREVSTPGGLSQIERVVETSNGALWVVQGDAVRRVMGGIAEPVPEQEVLSGRRIIHEGRRGTVWIAASDGVVAWRPDGAQIFRLPRGQSPAEVTNLHEDDGGALWIGTKGAGLRRLLRGQITTISVAHGLPSATIIQVLEDNRGRIWASGRNGIFAVSKRALDEVADGQRARLDASLYDANDGIQMQTTVVGHPAGVKDLQGRLWFATESGVVVFDPAKLKASPPKVMIDEVRIGREILPAGQDHAIGPGPSDLEARVSAKTFAPPETIAFRYRLDGRDRDWVDASATPSVRYAQLAPGPYRLSVMARSRDGAWGDQAASVAFVVRSPFHRSAWFALSCATAIAVALATAHRGRLMRTRAGMRATMAERARIAREIHDTLAQAFVATSIQLECVDHALEGGDQDTARRHLATAKTVVEESLDEARRSVWLLRPQALAHGLGPALDELVRRVAEGADVRLEIAGAPRPLPASIESNLLRIAQEALANALRHAEAGRVLVRLDYLPRTVTILVNDDGGGLPAPPPEPRDVVRGISGTGIAGMKDRAHEIGGILALQSVPGAGTTVRVEVPT